MALSVWLASLKSNVSSVSGVQVPIHEGLGRYVIETVGVSDVSEPGGMLAIDTADTVGKIQTYQPEPAWTLACTGDTVDTAGKISASDQVTEAAATPAQSDPMRIFRKRGPWLTGRESMDAQAYHAHHFHCPTCIATGRGTQYGTRCEVGLALWNTYTVTDDLQTKGGDDGQIRTG